MQSIEQIEHICCQNELDRAEVYWNAQDEEANELGDVARMFQCDTCDEHEDAWRLMSLSGTMR